MPAKRRVSPRLESLAAATGKRLGDDLKTKSSKAVSTGTTEQLSSKKSGLKRSSNDGDFATQPSGRTSKRTKKLSDVKQVVEPVVIRRSTRSCSQSSSVSAKSATKNSTERRMEEIPIIHAGDNRVVPQDFGLIRSSFKRDNFTYGIAYYDASERLDPLLCKNYVTDMFQQLYHAEVSRIGVITCACLHQKISLM